MWRISRWTPGKGFRSGFCVLFTGEDLRGWRTHFECFQVEVKERLVDGSKVLLDAGLAEAVCDAADESPVFGESLKNC